MHEYESWVRESYPGKKTEETTGKCSELGYCKQEGKSTQWRTPYLLKSRTTTISTCQFWFYAPYWSLLRNRTLCSRKIQQLVAQICPALWTVTGHWSSSNKLTFKTLCQVIHGLLFKEYDSLLKTQAIIAVEENSTLLCHASKIFSASLSSNYPHAGG
jgi:hypothetical protein